MIALLMMGSVGVMAEQNLPDPTQPMRGTAVVAKKVDAEQGYKLSWMITGKKNNMAVLNGQRVQKGDLVDGAEVLSITSAGVLLNVGHEQRLISLSSRKGFSKTMSGN
ncbi:MAG: hypothetical protein CSA61_01215 [Neptuniibacter caesariensis]|uniref:MSHA biogenesis protein MshK n=1 Tax=Neptuniibacter caesariensis TaxID=207954 RepID=A0A2G6JAW4_NEPCE|nr:MAG: hypothetical protein CSA61_01215 [Neptuniibacter caesariensis]